MLSAYASFTASASWCAPQWKWTKCGHVLFFSPVHSPDFDPIITLAPSDVNALQFAKSIPCLENDAYLFLYCSKIQYIQANQVPNICFKYTTCFIFTVTVDQKELAMHDVSCFISCLKSNARQQSTNQRLSHILLHCSQKLTCRLIWLMCIWQI